MRLPLLPILVFLDDAQGRKGEAWPNHEEAGGEGEDGAYWEQGRDDSQDDRAGDGRDVRRDYEGYRLAGHSVRGCIWTAGKKGAKIESSKNEAGERVSELQSIARSTAERDRTVGVGSFGPFSPPAEFSLHVPAAAITPTATPAFVVHHIPTFAAGSGAGATIYNALNLATAVCAESSTDTSGCTVIGCAT